MLEGFTRVNLHHKKKGSLFASFSSAGLRLSDSMLREMGSPAYISAYINKEKKQLALKVDKKKTLDSYRVSYSKKGYSLALPAKILRTFLADLMGWDYTTKSYRVDGTFDTAKALPISTSRHARNLKNAISGIVLRKALEAVDIFLLLEEVVLRWKKLETTSLPRKSFPIRRRRTSGLRQKF